MWHKTKDIHYSGSLCGKEVSFYLLAMNDDMIECESCLKLINAGKGL